MRPILLKATAASLDVLLSAIRLSMSSDIVSRKVISSGKNAIGSILLCSQEHECLPYLEVNEQIRQVMNLLEYLYAHSSPSFLARPETTLFSSREHQGLLAQEYVR